MFSLILHHGVVEHHKNHIWVKISGYDLLRQHVFFAWSTFPHHELDDVFKDGAHPPRSQVDPTMTFSFYEHSVCVRHLRVSFTCDRFV